MRITLFILLFSVFQVAAKSSYSQKARITLSMEDATIATILDEIEEQSEFYFLYNNKLIDTQKQVDIDVKREQISNILDELFDEKVEYSVHDRQIILSPAKAKQQSDILKITGIVKSADDNMPLPGVSIIVKGTTSGTSSDIDGTFQLEVKKGSTLIFSFMGMQPQEVQINDDSKLEINLKSQALTVNEVVVTALGLKREQKSLGYAVSKVDGEEISKVKTPNITSSLSGRIPGVNITSSPNLGGSTNIVIRGGSSITGSNQALYVIDGIPVSNASFNTGDNNRGGGGYDFGNFASDINPEDVESISVLKGASATALYGSRGANGVVLITTKKGKSQDRIGVTVSSSVTFEKINKETLPNYQSKYGGGSGDFKEINIDGTNYKVVEFETDESWGPKFDPTINVLHWDAFDPSDQANYLKPRPWVAAKNGPEGFFDTGILFVNNVSLDGASEKGNFRVSYTNTKQDGTVPNSELKKNNISFNGTLNLTDRFSTTVNAQYIKTYTKNRPGTGYDWENSRSFMASAGMWMQTNVDYKRLRNYQREDNGEQKTWNRAAWDNPYSKYWDNPYWTVYKNYPEDTRNRLVGSWSIDYKITDWLTATGRATIDHYDFTVETRIAPGSHGTSYYGKMVRLGTENNYDFMLKFNKNITEDFNINGMVGVARRDNIYEETGYGTTSGMVVDDLYTIFNSKSGEIGKSDWQSKRRVNSVYGTASFGYKNMLYLDFSARNDWSSTLPKDNNSYFYPSVSTSFIFSELMESDVLSFGKFRANWAQVGADAPFATLYDTYYNYGNHGSVVRYGKRTRKYNSELKPETAESYEIGLDLKFLNNRFGLDLSYYDKKSKDQIIPGSISVGTGFYTEYMNAGEKEDYGYEISLYANPIRTKDFKWDMTINWSKNISKINALAPGIESHVLNSNHVAVAARVGEPYGVLVGTDFIYDKLGNKIVDENGFYKQSDDNQIIGDINPDWRAGITNTFTYKNFSLNTLIDVKMGGDLFSLTHRWGRQTGILEETAVVNDLGNEVRLPVKEGGGLILTGVKEDGSRNDQRVDAKKAFDSANNPEAASIFDASYVKLREVALSYSLPKKLTDKLNINSLTLSLIGRNLAILHRKIDHIDPELTYGADNVQGLDIGTMPSTRSVGFSVKLGF
ncbi:MAG: SusC/RagA family TonB-linked outer membrane protein [Marinifilaceae bacterium]